MVTYFKNIKIWNYCQNNVTDNQWQFIKNMVEGNGKSGNERMKD